MTGIYSRPMFVAVLSVALFIPQIVSTATPPSPSPPGASPDLPEVTVIAPRPATASEIAGDNVMIFVNSHSKPREGGTGTLSRWKEAVCIKTEGLPSAFEDYVFARVEAIAAAVKTPQEKRNPCRPNVYVIFTNEPQRFIDTVADQNPELLGYHYTAQLKKLKTIDRPIQAWHVTGLQSEADLSGVVLDSVWAPPLIVPSATRISTAIQSFILFTLVVVDGKKISGYPLGAIADYIAMLALAQVRLIDHCGELPSILDLMATVCTRTKSQSITAADLAYLRSLNTVGQEVDYFIQTKAIEFKMKKQLTSR